MSSKIKFQNVKNKRHIITVDIIKERSLYDFLSNSNEWKLYINIKKVKSIFTRG